MKFLFWLISCFASFVIGVCVAYPIAHQDAWQRLAQSAEIMRAENVRLQQELDALKAP